MWWLWSILSILLLAIFWLLISTVQISIDTRIPFAEIRWRSIGSASLWWDHHWKFRFRLLFFSKTMDWDQALASMNRPKPEKKSDRKKKSENRNFSKEKILALLKTFQVDVFNLAIDTGSYVTNARLYPLNYFPALNGHIQVNFLEQNYMVLKIRNRPLRMLLAFLKK